MEMQQVSPASPTLFKRLPSWTLLALLIASFTYTADRLVRVQLRVEGLESSRLDETLRLQRNVHGQILSMDERLESNARGSKLAQDLSFRVLDTESRLGDLGEDLFSQASTLDRIQEFQERFGPDHMTAQLEEYDAESNLRIEAIAAQMATVESNALEASAAIRRLGASPAGTRNLEQMWDELVGPIVQLSGDVSVGSGVLLQSRRDEASGSYLTHVLTAWHVVRDIQGDLSKTEMPVPVTVYSQDGQTEHTEAKLLVFNVRLDAALLEITSEAPFRHGASLASPKRLDDLEIFDEVYAVGCPLGNDPIPTAGEIATVRHKVDGSNYMMINAPTYIGNSGGGIFDANTHELLGIFSKIYTHGSLRPTIVPHMGLVTPLTHIYEWLRAEGLASVVPGTRDAKLAAR